jgi:hypothetical protein
MRYRLALALAGVLVGSSSCMTPAGAGSVRYVAPSQGNAAAEYPLWRGWLEARQCGRAQLTKRDERQWCEEGTTPGVKPKVGVLTLGSEVAVIDDTECRDMVHVRVLTGPSKGAVGCIEAWALSTRKPG